MIKKIVFYGFFMFFSLFLLPAQELYRYGIFVSSSRGYNEENLPGAAEEVKQVARLFREYCRLDKVVILEDPDNETLNAAFDSAGRIIGSRDSTGQSQFFFYYYGHGLPRGLLLDHELYRKDLLKEKVAAIEAELKVILLDACSSQVLGDEEKLDFSTRSTGTVFLTSSTRFQKAYVGVFTPILKAALMGDADGFIPRLMDASFFYNEIVSLYNSEEKNFLQSLYGLNEYYTYQEPSIEEGQQVEKIVTALGMDSVPPALHITALEKQLLERVQNSMDKKMILSGYNYSQTCRLKEDLTAREKERLVSLLSRGRIKKDRYITLSELFSYLYTRVAEKNIDGQRPTINTGLLLLSSPIRISYIQNKASLQLALPGTVFIKRVLNPDTLETVLKLLPRLDEGEPVNLALEPGEYVLFIDTGQAEYRVTVELKPRQEPILLEKLEWENLVAYKDGGIWQDKAALDKKLKINRITAWVPPFVTFSLFSAPFSLLFTGIYYNYEASMLHEKYKAEDNPRDIVSLREQIEKKTEIRNYLYIAAGACFTLPVVPFIIWMVRIIQSKRLTKEAERLKARFSFNYLPQITIQPDSLDLALVIKM